MFTARCPQRQVFLKESTVLVTGGAGAIGSHLVRQLLENNYFVIVLDDLSSGRRENCPDDSRLIFVKGSILDLNLLEGIFTKYSIEIVFHMAAHFANQNSVEHPEADLLTNTLGTLRLLEFSKRSSVNRFVYASSSCIYGNSTGLISADFITKLETPYAISKLSGEGYVHFYHHFHKLKTTVVRYFNSYGPYDRPGPYRSVIPNFIWRAMNRQPLIITGTGKETRDFTYVEDIVQGTLLAATQDSGIGQIFDIGTGIETEIIQLAEKINQITGNPAGIQYCERRKWDEITRRKANIEKAQKLLNYQPQVSLEEGLKRTYQWLQNESLSYTCSGKESCIPMF
jgi:nucleoside-diphosphate-sugar epimerase